MPAEGSPAASSPRVQRILIVDDVAEVRQELCRLLPLLAPVEVVGSASGGLEALQLAAALAPDTVILDLEMPVMDGCEAARRIKQARPACRIVGLSIHGSETDRRNAQLAGMDALIFKGAPLESLVRAVVGGRSDD